MAELYDSHITESYIVNADGRKVDGDLNPFDVNVAMEKKKPAAERLLPVFVCNTDKGVKYIVPVYGAGLWGPIWGYIAMDSNGDTIYGAYFAHQGETPGLGAEIENDGQGGEERSGTRRRRVRARHQRRHDHQPGRTEDASGFAGALHGVLQVACIGQAIVQTF